MPGDDTIAHLTRLGLTPPEQPAEGLESFKPGELYQPHARPAGLQMAIHFIFCDRSIITCQYADLDSGSEFRVAENGGELLHFRFKASIISEAIVEGRNLWQLYDYITRHRMPWVHELPAERDFEAKGAAVIRRLTFRPVGLE